jgi:hypothetical protein
MLAIVAAIVTIGSAVPAQAQTQDVAHRTCNTLGARVDAVPGSAAVFLRSYDGKSGQGLAEEPALNGAFIYDNALAAIALVACDHTTQAKRIGDALLLATNEDRAGPRGRLRNAYRPGAQNEHPIPPMGWWSDARKEWLEDPYQVGTATGNVAWAGLALVTLSDATHDARYSAGAQKLADWIVANTTDRNGIAGFTGGIFADGALAQPLTWKATEHAVDLEALFTRLGMDTPKAEARSFLDIMWTAGGDHFPTGAGTDGATVNRATSGLDAQLWPMLLAGAPPDWQHALTYAERAHGITTNAQLSGFDFNNDRDGVWLEGTAQAALVYRHLGRAADADRMLATIAGQISPGGYVWATRDAKLTTGLAIGPDSVTDDFLYYRLPHLGATAWAALAATGWNPFTGRRIK